jgi:hypothetical protein
VDNVTAVEVVVSDADVVLRQLIVSLGGLCVGSAVVFAIWHARVRAPRRLATAGLLLSFAIIGVLTTDHIYRHLVEDDAPIWQLWGGLVGFTLGAVSIIASLIQLRGGRPR